MTSERTFFRWIVLGSLMAGVIGNSAALGQVSARQGARADDPLGAIEQTDFESPMVIELPLTGLAPSPGGTPVSAGDKIGKFRCDSISVSSLVVTESTSKTSEIVTVKMVLRDPPGRDKRVGVRYQLLSREKVIGEIVERDIETEEDDVSSREISIPFPLGKLGSTDLLKLRVSIGVRNLYPD